MTMRKGGIIQETMDRSEVQVENIPVYRHSAEYAVQHGEAFSYYESFDANQKCAAAIEKAVEDNYHDNHLDSKAVLAQVKCMEWSGLPTSWPTRFSVRHMTEESPKAVRDGLRRFQLPMIRL